MRGPSPMIFGALVMASGLMAARADAADLVIRTISEGSPAAALQVPGRGRVPTMSAWPARAPEPPAPTGRLFMDAYATEIILAVTTHGIEESWVRAIIHAESAFDPAAVSPKGAQGLMQLIPATAARFGVVDPFDPAENIRGGVEYLAYLLARYEGDRQLATAAYNAGEGAVDRYDGIPPYPETQNYVAKVTALSHRYERAVAETSATLSMR